MPSWLALNQIQGMSLVESYNQMSHRQKWIPTYLRIQEGKIPQQTQMTAFFFFHFAVKILLTFNDKTRFHK